MKGIELVRDGEYLTITETSSSGWIGGRLREYEFQAKVFAEHAVSPDYELGRSKISKLHLRRLSDGENVVCFERGWEFEPTDERAIEVVTILCAHLAEIVYGPNQKEIFGSRVKSPGDGTELTPDRSEEKDLEDLAQEIWDQMCSTPAERTEWLASAQNTREHYVVDNDQDLLSGRLHDPLYLYQRMGGAVTRRVNAILFERGLIPDLWALALNVGRRALEALSAENKELPKFPFGKIVVTSAAAASIPLHDRLTALWMHGQGHWGTVSEDEAVYNDRAMRHGGRIRSGWKEGDLHHFQIITHADRLRTTIALQAEW